MRFSLRFALRKKGSSSMQSPLRSLAVMLLVPLLLVAGAAGASTAPQLSGSYKITEDTDLGAQVRIAVELKLLNTGDAAVTITTVSLRSFSSPHQLVSVPTTLTVQPHANASVSLQFLMPKQDFSNWSLGPHQQFLFSLQSAESRLGKPTVANILLLRTKG
jgi:hypothetical protein